MNGASVFFYGRLAGSSRKDAERVARASGYRIASSLLNAPSIVVLGEGESLAQTRARLAEEFDSNSRDAFERGALELLAETEFFRRLAESEEKKRDVLNEKEPLFAVLEPLRSDDQTTGEQGYTPAAVAELSGVSILAIRRWNKRGFLTSRRNDARLPVFSSREVIVAKRLAFLCSAGLSEDFIAKRLASFAKFPDAPQEVGLIILKTTTSTDGRELLFLREDEPVDWRGQRRFDFAAFPTDGSFEKPSAPLNLSPVEEQIALAERLAAWNADATDKSGAPAFLSLFQGGSGAIESPSRVSDVFDLDSESNAPSFVLSNESRALWRQAAKRSVVEICEEAWKLERDGYWEEAARVYRSASFLGGLEPGVCFRLGKVLFLLGDYSAARERFYATLELDENFVDARIELGKTFVALNELDDALAAFQGALKDKPDDPILLVESGKLYLQLGKREAAQDAFRAAVQKIDDQKLAEDVKRILLDLALRKIDVESKLPE